MTDFAKRIAHLEPEGAYAVLARAQELEAQGRDIIHLEIGQPDFDTYPHVVLAGIRALTTGKTRYNPPSGIKELRLALAEDAGARRGVQFTPEQVVVAPGTKPLLLLPMMALLERGDEVITPDPGFPTYEAAIRLVGAVPVPVPPVETAGFDLDLEAFDAALGERTRMIILNSPSNPTGGILSRETLEHVAAAVRQRDCWILSDEIYARLVYDGEAPSIISLPGMAERTILADGFSKTYAMTGWRLGWCTGPTEIIEKMTMLQQYSFVCAPSIAQSAGLAALGCDMSRHAAAYKRKRDMVYEALAEPFGLIRPQGAFYAFVPAPKGTTGTEFVARAIENNVLVIPGNVFSESDTHFRLAYTVSDERLAEGLEILVRLAK
jgi:aspartate aminotransferase